MRKVKPLNGSVLFNLRRWLTRSERSIRLLGLNPSAVDKDEQGLILIQIDGLSHAQISRALERREMRFLKHLVDKQRYHLERLYPGLPSSTPATQAELFYGVQGALPAFSFFDESESRIFTMYNGDSARKMEKRLQQSNAGLLRGGSSYSNVYSGGAQEAHFCAVSLAWPEMLRNIRPLRWVLFLLTNLPTVFITVWLMIWESMIAMADFITGLKQRQNFFKELKFIPTRPLLCILLRELVTMSVKLDITRGLPVIHANFIGYDEQSHRRGPSSKFAHWTLPGIDGAIRRIYRQALTASRRHYDIWIYSDHGQQDTRSYVQEHGRTVQSAVSAVAQKLGYDFTSRYGQNGIQLQRLRYLEQALRYNVHAGNNGEKFDPEQRSFIVTAIGPTGNIYLPEELSCDEKIVFARNMVSEAAIPLVAFPARDRGRLWVFTAKGEFLLPKDAAAVFGAEHPYLKAVTDDFIKLCSHRNAGAFTICGWCADGKPWTFPAETGAHAGPGTEETNAFTLTPPDILRPAEGRKYHTTRRLREAALRYLRLPEADSTGGRGSEHMPKERRVQLRVMTLNTHSCVGTDGNLSPARIARIIARHEPDIVALQELDINRPRTGNVDQPRVIARFLQMFYHFHPAIHVEEEQYGNAVLSRFPVQLIATGALPGDHRAEPRGVLWVRVDIQGQKVDVLNTHLSYRRKECERQAQALAGTDWLGNARRNNPTILCGDFNAGPDTMACKKISRYLRNVTSGTINVRTATWMSRFPLRSVDHLFFSHDIEVVTFRVSRSDLDRRGSDHLPLIADLRLPIRVDN